MHSPVFINESQDVLHSHKYENITGDFNQSPNHSKITNHEANHTINSNNGNDAPNQRPH